MKREAQLGDGQQGDQPPLIEGKYAILAVLILSFIAAVGAWWYRGQLQRQAIAFLGSDNAALIQRAPRVSLMELARENSSARDDQEKLAVAEGRFVIVRSVEVGQAPGLVHLRNSLINDRSFDWSTQADACKSDWQYALQFAADDRPGTIILLDFVCERLTLAGNKRQASMAPMAAGLKAFIAEQFHQASDSAARNGTR